MFAVIYGETKYADLLWIMLKYHVSPAELLKQWTDNI